MKSNAFSVVILFVLLSQFVFVAAQDKRSDIVIIDFSDGKNAPETLYKNSFALVIGVTDYTNGWNDLPGVTKDVAEVQEVLKKQNFQVTTLTNPTNDVLFNGVKKFLDDYGYEYENRLLIYFAGHGHTQKLPDGREFGYIIPADAPLPNKSIIEFQKKAVSMDTIQFLAKQAQSKHILFVFDSCFSGKLISRDGARIPAFIRESVATPVRQFITSGTANQTVPDESIFRKFFVRGLEGEADRNKDGYILGSELADFLRENVINYSDGTQSPQYGKIRDIDLDKGDFVFLVPKPNRVELPTASNTKKTKVSLEFWEKQRAKALEPRNAPTGFASTYDEELIAEKKALGEKILERALAGEDFAKLAKEFSEDPANSKNGGLFENIEEGTFAVEFEAAAFALETGQISDELVETPFGFHIIKLEGMRDIKGQDGTSKRVYDVRHILFSTDSTNQNNGQKDPLKELVVPEELRGGQIKQTAKIKELNLVGRLPMDFVGLANLFLNKELTDLSIATDDYFLDMGGNVTEDPFSVFDYEKGSSEIKKNSKEFQTLSRLANDFSGEKYDLNNPADRKTLKQNLLRMLNPKAIPILEEISRAYRLKFNRPLRVTSMVRSIEYQVSLSKTNANSFMVRGKDSVPPHTTGLSIDLARKQMTAEEQNFVMQKLAELERQGKVDALIEWGANACFHIFVYPDGKPPKIK